MPKTTEKRKVWLEKYRPANRAKIKAYKDKWKKENQNGYIRELHRRTRQEIFDILGRECVICGYNKDVRALHIDHIYGGGGKDRKGISGTTYFRRMLKYIQIPENPVIYQILCANCNFIKKDSVDPRNDTYNKEKANIWIAH